MKTHLISMALIAVLALLAASSLAMANECDDGGCINCASCAADDGTANYIEAGAIVTDLDGSETGNDQRGLLPDGFVTSGRLHFPADGWDETHFELRWQDITSDNGRAWARLSWAPLTLELDSYIMGNYAWNDYAGLALQEQEVSSDDVKLRWHRGELDNGVLRFQRMEFNREGDEPLNDFDWSRLSYAHNFNFGCGETLGSVSQTATNFDDPRHGVSGGEIDTTALKLDRRVNDRLKLFGRGSVSQLDYPNMTDTTMSASDYTVGFSYIPADQWELKADLSSKDNPDDNTVSSHFQGYDAYGLQLSFSDGCDNRLEAGYRHRSLDYAQLNIRDAQVGNLIRGTAVVTPAQVAHATNFLTPDLNELWFSGRWALSDKLTTDAKVSFIDGSAMPETDLSGTYTASLFYEQRLDRSVNLYYDVNGNDQLAFMYTMNESSNEARGTDFDLQYMQGSWSRCIGADGYLALVVSNSDAEFDSDTLADDYTTDELTYAANYSRELCNYNYGLNMAFTTGDGVDEYEQVALGADLALKEFGPLSFRVDWFDRDYTAQDTLSSQALEVSMRYKLEF